MLQVCCLSNLLHPLPSSLKLLAPLQARKARLADAEKLKRFLHDVEDEEAWIREKEPIASSTNTGKLLLIDSAKCVLYRVRNH